MSSVHAGRILGLVAVLALGLVVGMVVFRKNAPPPRFHDGRVIPPEGLVFNPRARIPFDASEVERDFKRLYAAIDGFRQLHRRFPTTKELRDFSKELVPGIRLSHADFQTPDALNADFYAQTSPERSDYGFAYPNPRPDGSPRPTFPAPGEKDVWLGSSACARWDQRIFQDGHSETHHFGYHIVLWSDGSIERIPEKRTILFRSPEGGFQLEFPGQAGLPKTTWTRLEMDRLEGAGKFNKVSYE